jgi:HTH-type transcriptional regulator, quorum sensing regulator NprR
LISSVLLNMENERFLQRRMTRVIMEKIALCTIRKEACGKGRQGLHMKNEVGFLVRHYRLQKNLSQEDLCKGICAVSYLSKIEKGTANPGEDIIRLLFSALNVDFHTDEDFLREIQIDLNDYFEHVIYCESSGPEEARLLLRQKEALHSTLFIGYSLFMIYVHGDRSEEEEVRKLLLPLAEYVPFMDADQLFYYTLAQGFFAAGGEAAIPHFRRAKELKPFSVAPYYLGEMYNAAGAYQQAIHEAQLAFSLAAEEGNTYVLLHASLLTAMCYSNLYHVELMLKFYRQAEKLASKIAPEEIPWIYYNIGATLVNMRRSGEGLPYLLKADVPGAKHDMLLCHKLAIACFDTGRREEAAGYLQKAEKLIGEGKATPMEEKLIRVVKYRLAENYLEMEEYYTLLKEVYEQIGKELPFGFKQFHGNLLIEACVHNRKYKEALKIASEINAFPGEDGFI